MSDATPTPTRAERRGRVVRWLLPLAGSAALLLGGFGAVEVSQSGSGPTPAANPVSVSLYALMIGLYAGVSAVVRRRRQPMLPASERRFRAGCEALLVGFVGAPAIALALVARALYVGDLGQ